MSYPYWATPAQLGTYGLGYSFTQTPINLIFGESLNQACTVSVLNGELPTGIIWKQNGFQVELRGVLENITENTTFAFTLRIDNGTYKSDKTFYLSVTTPVITSFAWVTDNQAPLSIIYDAQLYEAQVQASVVPTAEITYNITNLNVITQGINIDATTGVVTINLPWRPNTAYAANRDYVYNNLTLYVCIISGVSANSSGPLGVGTDLVDSNYPAWRNANYYPVNAVVYNDLGKLYLCVSTGVSGNTGPSGAGSFILDGSCVWQYISQCPVWNPTDSTNTILLNVSATSSTETLSRTFELSLLQSPAAPQWITPAGVLLSQDAGSEVIVQLAAFDPTGTVLTWHKGALWPTWLNLNNLGLVYGVLPYTSQSVTYDFDVQISNSVSDVTRSFSFSSLAGEINFYWSTASDLGVSPDGNISDKLVQAVSLRATGIMAYGLTGGMTPPGVILNNETGALEGFVEYHGQNKTYYFEISAQDSSETIVQKFKWQVQSQNWGKFWSLSVPVLGTQRRELLSLNNSNIVDDSHLYLSSDRGWGRPQNLAVPIITGIKHINAADLKNSISNWLHNFRLVLTDLKISNYDNSTYELVSVVIRDSDSVKVWQAHTAYVKGERVTNPDGLRYVCVQSGTSGHTAPRGDMSLITDGSTAWQYDSVPLSFVNKSYPLPWYPYHYYTAQNTVVNQGQIYKSLSNGYSAGGTGPQGTGTNIVDNQIQWQQIANSPPYSDANTFWPANIHNIRGILAQTPGWSTAWGTGAIATVNVNPNTTGIDSVVIVQSGQEYWASPTTIISGVGTGAQLQARVGMVGVTLVSSSLGFAVNDVLEVDLGEGLPGLLKVSAVNSIGAVQAVFIVDQGNFDKIPQNNLTLSVAQGTVTVRIQAGIVEVQVIAPGTGFVFGETQITFTGAEINRSARSEARDFDLELPLAFVTADSAGTVAAKLPTTQNTFSSQVIPVTVIKATVEGIQWQAYTRLDQDYCTFDAMSTAWVDVDSAVQTTWDATATYWDNSVTVFDSVTTTQAPDWSQTIFDSNQTIFDYYATLFDQKTPTYESKHSKSWFWNFGKPYDL